jgi:predicted CXXCH cytochrome family protein
MQSDSNLRTSCFERRRRLWYWYALRWPVFAGVILAVIIGLLGCDPKTKYEVLTFFFDGVPLLPGMKGYRPDGLILDPSDPRAKAFLARDRARKAREKAAKTPTFAHKPYATFKCKACHDRSKSYSSVSVETCRSCHKSHFDTKWDDWVHGPVSLGKCSLCHLPHTSKHKGLLTKAPRDLCTSCHDKAKVLAGPHHVEASFKGCTECHDPHFAGNRLLLADAISYRRRKGGGAKPAKGHSAWKKDVCSKCHDVKRSNTVLPNAGKMCVTCHDKVQHPIAGGKIHEPVSKGKCLSCHTPHAGKLAHLIRPNAERNCIGCHKLEKLSTPRHSRFYRVDCLLCHAGHSSPKKHLLRVPDPPPRPTTLPATMPATTTMPATATENRP